MSDQGFRSFDPFATPAPADEAAVDEVLAEADEIVEPRTGEAECPKLLDRVRRSRGAERQVDSAMAKAVALAVEHVDLHRDLIRLVAADSVLRPARRLAIVNAVLNAHGQPAFLLTSK